MQAHSEGIINGMQVPLEFIKGGMSYAGTNVSMRMLENQFIGYIQRQKELVNWVVRQVADFMKWPVARVRFKPFKMADDIQRKAYLFQLNTAGKLSDSTLLADADLNQAEEDKMMISEASQRVQATEKQQLAMAEIQGKQQLIMMKQQAKAQQEMQTAMQQPPAPGEPGAGAAPGQPGAPVDPTQQAAQQMPPDLQVQGPGGAAIGQPPQGGPGAQGPMAQMQSPLNMGQDMGVTPEQQAQGVQPGLPTDITAVAIQWAQQLSQMDPTQQYMAIKQLRQQSPELAELVLQYMSSMGSHPNQQQPQQGVPGADGKAATEINMTPLPEQKPPRRAAGIV
jgi:hypothetical protein